MKLTRNILTLLAMLTLIGSPYVLLAQNEGEQPEATPGDTGQMPPAEENTPAGPHQENQPENQTAPVDDDYLMPLVLPNNPLTEVLATYEHLSGKRLIRDIQSLANAPQSNYNIVVQGEIHKSEAIRLIETLLLLNNIILIPGPDNTLKVMGLTKNPRAEAIPLYTDPESLPITEQLISYYMPLKYINAQNANNFFNQHLGARHPYGGITSVPSSQALVITENVSVVKYLIELKDLIDIQPAETISQFVQLSRADAENVAKTITDIIKNRKSKSTSPQPVENISQDGEVPPPAAVVPQSEESGAISGDVQLVPDSRTNRILVITQKSNFDYVVDLIHEFDRAIDLIKPLEFSLQYLSATEALPVLQTILAEGKDSKSDASASSASNSSTPTTSTSASSGTEGTGSVASLQAPSQDTSPKSISVGKTHIIADPRANSIMVFGPPENIEKVRTILTKLDKRPLQVYLNSVIGQLSLGNDLEYGIDLLQKFGTFREGGISGAASGLRTRTDGIVDPLTLTSTTALAAALPTSGLTVYGTLGRSLNAYVKALESTNRFKLLSRPSVFAENNKLAIISSGTEVPVPDSIISNNTFATNSVAQNATIQFKKVLLNLQVVPLINPNKEVKLTVVQQNDSVTGSQTISGITVPTIGTQNITTTITLNDRETAIIGGLITESTSTDTAGIPFISRIPLIGYLFKNTTKAMDRSELIVLIQPVVIENSADLISVQREENARSKVSQDAFKMSEPKAPVNKPQGGLRLRYPEVRP